ncbi:MAG: hypothetical protein ACXABY_32715 [Candidatus Thorarchaeota archaeon]|jgi:hypothetical protein
MKHPDSVTEMTEREAKEAGIDFHERRIASLQKRADIGNFCETHTPQQLHAVMKYCWMFNVRLDLANYIDGYLRALRERHYLKQEELVSSVALQLIDDYCPWCGAQMQGGLVPNCETQRTKRVSYKECTECEHYCEKFITAEDLYRLECYPWESKLPGHTT